MKMILVRWLPLVISMATIFLLSMNHDPYRALPIEMREPVQIAQTKFEEGEQFGIPGHVLEFALLGLTAGNALIWKKNLTFNIFVITLIACILYALSDEIHQIFVPGRAFEISDLLLDFIGSILGLIVYWMFRSMLSRQKVTENG